MLLHLKVITPKISFAALCQGLRARCPTPLRLALPLGRGKSAITIMSDIPATEARVLHDDAHARALLLAGRKVIGESSGAGFSGKTQHPPVPASGASREAHRVVSALSITVFKRPKLEVNASLDQFGTMHSRSPSSMNSLHMLANMHHMKQCASSSELFDGC